VFVWLKNLNYVLRAVVALVLGGIVAVYIPGILWFATLNKFPILAVATGNLPFLVGDSVKIVIAVLVLLGLKAAYPKALDN
jgi:biotin transport system substrate-specific component